MDGWMEGWMEGLKDGRTEGWTDGARKRRREGNTGRTLVSLSHYAEVIRSRLIYPGNSILMNLTPQ